MTVTKPYRNHYGEWTVYFAEKIRDKLMLSNRDYLRRLGEKDITLGRFTIGLEVPHIYIVNTRHNIEEANVGGGKLQGQFAYDVVVEHTYPGDLDHAEKEAILITGDIISELHLDPHLLDYDGTWTSRGLSLEFLEPEYPLDPTTDQMYVQCGVRVTILKSMELA